MRVLVSGATGLVGTALCSALESAGDEVVALSRSEGGRRATVRWNPAAGRVDGAGLKGLGAVIHLAGEPLAGGRWTAAKKQRIRSSRVEGTRLLAEALAACSPPPRALLLHSAVGYYGDRGEEVLDEDSPPGRGFLADVCREWEDAAEPAREAGVRVVHLRLGLVLSPAGGALQQMLRPFRLGLGGVVGTGRQYWSWVALEDAVGAVRHLLAEEVARGPVNVVAPAPVTCASFVDTLGAVLRRPTFVPLPSFAARLVLGEMAEETLLASARVRPARLLEQGYGFRHGDLEEALRGMLARPSRGA